MVNWPKEKKTLCKKCKKHETHKVSIYKAGKRRGTGLGDRRYKRKQEGYGGQTRPIFHKNVKGTKITVIKLTCSKCKSIRQVEIGRNKKMEIGGEKKAEKGAPSW